MIVQDGLRRMLAEQEDVFYYLTLMNENYSHPALTEGARRGSSRACTSCAGAARTTAPRVQLLGSGTILREVLAGADLLAQDFGVAADVWSVTSFTELRREGIDADRWNMLHPTEEARVPWVTRSLADREGPVIASTDYVRTFADGIRPFIDGPLPGARHGRLRAQRLPAQAAALLRGRPPLRRGRRAEGAGRSGQGRARDGQEAIDRYEIDTDRPAPFHV